jgi:type VI secretion system lysozyme-like protein
MSPFDPTVRLKPSILSRLTDTTRDGAGSSSSYDLDDMAAAIQVDLENLLNTPRPFPDVPAAYPELVKSIANYGMRELVSRSGSTPEQQAEIAKELETVISVFEPRLQDVRAEVLAESQPTKLRVRVSAKLRVDSAPNVAFDTILELSTGRCWVNQSQG